MIYRLDTMTYHFFEKNLFGTKMVVDRGDIDTGTFGNLSNRSPSVTPLSKFNFGRFDDFYLRIVHWENLRTNVLNDCLNWTRNFFELVQELRDVGGFSVGGYKTFRSGP